MPSRSGENRPQIGYRATRGLASPHPASGGDGMMKSVFLLTFGAMLVAAAALADDAAPKAKDTAADKLPSAKIEHLKPNAQTSDGSVTVAGSRIDYQAIAGTLIVHPKDWDDTPKIIDQDQGAEDQPN